MLLNLDFISFKLSLYRFIINKTLMELLDRTLTHRLLKPICTIETRLRDKSTHIHWDLHWVGRSTHIHWDLLVSKVSYRSVSGLTGTGSSR